MACDFCDDDYEGVKGVEDREALAEFICALLSGDIPLARILAGRTFVDGDRLTVENTLARAKAVRA